MSVALFFDQPDGNTNPNLVSIKIWESLTETGTYSLVETAAIQKYPYYQNYYIYQGGDLKKYYKISWISLSGVESAKSNAANYMRPSITDSPILGIRYILAWRMRNDAILLDRNGEYCNLFLRKTSGKHCTCYNEEVGSGRYDCEDCYGTGYEDGYDIALNAKIRFLEGNPRKLVITEGGLVVDARPTGWTKPDLPLINGDVIKRLSTNKRYRLQDVKTPGTISAVVSRYEFMLAEIDQKDVVNKIG